MIEIVSDYYPKPTQARFHKSNARFKGFKGSKGSGKTRAIIEEAIALCIDFPENRGIIARLDLEDLKETTMHFFFKFCPPELIAGQNRSEHWVLIRNPRGGPSRIKFAHCKDAKSFESGEIGFFVIDEADEIPEETVKTLRTRLRLKGVAHYGLFAFNPPPRSHWLYNFFIDEVKADPSLKSDRQLFENNTMENIDNLPANYIQELKNTYSGDALRRYLYGEWGSVASEWSVYTDYREALHRSLIPLNHVPGIPIIRAWDFGMSAACVFMQLVNSQLRILREVVRFNCGAEQFAPTVLSESQVYQGIKFIDLSDPTFIHNRSQVDARTIKTVLSKHFGLHLKDGVAAWELRPSSVQHFLTRLVASEPALIIDPSCKLVLGGFEGGYRYAEGSATRTANDVEDNEYTHVHDCVQHGAWYCRNKILQQADMTDAEPAQIEDYSFSGYYGGETYDFDSPDTIEE